VQLGKSRILGRYGKGGATEKGAQALRPYQKNADVGAQCLRPN